MLMFAYYELLFLKMSTFINKYEFIFKPMWTTMDITMKNIAILSDGW